MTDGLPATYEEAVPEVPESSPVIAEVSTSDALAALKAWQRRVMQARSVIVGHVYDEAARTSHSLNNCIADLLRQFSAGALSAHLSRAIDDANHRKGRGRTLSKPTIYNWCKAYAEVGQLGLAPKDKAAETELNIPEWAEFFLDLFRRPEKQSLSEIVRQMGPGAPPEHQVRRFVEKFSRLDLLRGRMSGSALRAYRGYTKRDFSALLPMDIIVADGHSFKAYVSHPVHGKRFLPEVETVIDVASRAVVGWSAGLAESGQIVADAIRYAVTVSDAKPMGGQPAIFYADNGAGNRAKMNSDEVTGILARIGCTAKFGIAGNPQGRGIIERLNKSLWIPAAKKLLTYNGKDMDALSQRKRLKIVDKDLKTTGVSQQLISWPQFVEFLAYEVGAYNSRPHASLPKIVDQGGHTRHMTPSERWQVFVAEGWQPDTLNPEVMRDLFRPQIECTTSRGLVRVFTNDYFSSELEHHHGERVFVNYDIHDPNIVWVRDRQQRLICEAKWNGNRRHYFPLAVVEQARQQRKDRRLALKYEQIREIEAEAMGVVAGEAEIPDECVETVSSEQLIVSGEREITDTPVPHNVGHRPFFGDEIERYEWHLRNGFKEDEDLCFKREFEASDNYQIFFDQQ